MRRRHFDLFKLVSKQISISGVRLRKPWCGGGIATSLVSLCKLRFSQRIFGPEESHNSVNYVTSIYLCPILPTSF